MIGRRSITIVLFVAAIVTVVLVGVPAVLDLGGSSPNQIVYVVLKTTQPDMEFWQVVRAGIQAAATDYDLRPIVVGPRRETDVDGQIDILREVIEVEPEAILLVASDFTRLVPLAKEADERGITMVTLDSALDSDVPASFVATDNVAAGRKAGKEIIRLVAPGRDIAVVSHVPGVATAIDRELGVLEVLRAHTGYPILDTVYSQNDPDRAYQLAVQILDSTPNLGGIVALNENSTIGVGRALRDLGVFEHVHLVGFDNSKEEIKFLEDGIADALVVQRPFNMGYVGIRAVARTLRGEIVAPVIHTDAVLVQRDEMFSEENQRLLFPLITTRPTYENDYSVDDSQLRP